MERHNGNDDGNTRGSGRGFYRGGRGNGGGAEAGAGGRAGGGRFNNNSNAGGKENGNWRASRNGRNSNSNTTNWNNYKNDRGSGTGRGRGRGNVSSYTPRPPPPPQEEELVEQIRIFQVMDKWENFRLVCVGERGVFTLDVETQANQNLFDVVDGDDNHTRFYVCKILKTKKKHKDHYRLVEFHTTTRLVIRAGLIPFRINQEKQQQQHKQVLVYRNRNTDGFIQFKFTFKDLLFNRIHGQELDTTKLAAALDKYLVASSISKWSSIEINAFINKDTNHKPNISSSSSTFFQAFWELDPSKKPLPTQKLKTLQDYVASKIDSFGFFKPSVNENWKFFGGSFEEDTFVNTPKKRALQEVQEELGWKVDEKNVVKELSVPIGTMYQELYYVVDNLTKMNLPLFPHGEIQEIKWINVDELLSNRNQFEGIKGEEWTQLLEELSNHTPINTSFSSMDAMDGTQEMSRLVLE